MTPTAFCGHGRLLATALAAALAGCTRPAPLPEVRLHVAADLPAEAMVVAAAWARLARVVPATRPEDAELAWLSDPVAALALEQAAPGSAPAAAGVPADHLDPGGRFAPLGGRAAVLLARNATPLPFEPGGLRSLADARLRGRVALVPFGRGQGPVLVAALALVHGDPVVDGFLERLAANGPVLAASAAEVRSLVASGAADVGLADSTQAAAAAASAAGLRVIWPEQHAGRGAVLLPTALVVLPGAGEGARALAAWLAGPDGERLLVARVPGLLPLREGVPVPPGVVSAGNLRLARLDWDALAAEARVRAEHLVGWPEVFAPGGPPPRRPDPPPP